MFYSGGATVMERKDGTFTDIWNFGFDKIVRNGEYKALCELTSVKHGEYYSSHGNRQYANQCEMTSP